MTAAGGRLEVVGVTKRYGATAVLRDVGLTVENGEFMTILGPSGSGKTTILRLIGGFTEPEGQRSGIGALLLGVYDDGKLRYAGKVGTGYDAATLRQLHRKLAPLARRTSPFGPGPVPAGQVRWVTPKLVAQIGFGEWTTAGLLRHPRYLGLRDDKAAREVRREG